MARVLGYGGLANTNGARDFSSKGVAIGSQLILVGMDATAPLITKSGILVNDEFIRSIVRKYTLWPLFVGTYTVLKQLLG